jgi:hypothetical protein
LPVSILPATAVIKSKSVLSEPPAGVVIKVLSVLFDRDVISTDPERSWFPNPRIR